MPINGWWNDDGGPQPWALGMDPADAPTGLKRAAFDAAAPSPDQVAADEAAQNEHGALGFINTLLSMPEKLFLGQAIKGAVKGGIEGGFEGAVKGFARGTPIAFLGEALGLGDWADETHAADIRRALGQSNVEEGWGNFFINLGLDIALSPLELASAPFGLTAKGEAAFAKGALSASISKAVDTGERALLTFKLPKIGILGSTNLGFKSGSNIVAQGVDGLFSALRTNKATRGILKAFSFVTRIEDPEAAAQVSKAAAGMDQTRKQAALVIKNSFEDNVRDPSVRSMVQSGKYGSFFITAAEAGLEKIDDLGTFDLALKNLGEADVFVRKNRAAAQIASGKDKTLSDLWEKATGRDPKEAYDAIQSIYAAYPSIPLSDDMLKAAELAPRAGVELSAAAANAPTFSEKLGEAAGTSAATGTGSRAIAARNVVPDYAGSMQRAYGKVQNEYKDLVEQMAAGVYDKDSVNAWMKFHRDQYIRLGMADMEHGFISEASEPFLGFYASRIISPQAMDLAEKHFASTLQEYSYSMPRKLRDMLTIEVNAVAEDFGTKATGFVALNKLKDTSSDSILGAIFNEDFVKKMAKVDPNAVEFFQTLPYQNLARRAELSATKMADLEFSNKFIQFTAKESLTPDAFAKRAQELLDPTGKNVAVVEAGSGKLKGLTRDAAMEKAAGYERGASLALVRKDVRTEAAARMAQSKELARSTLEELESARSIFEDSVPDALTARKTDLLSTNKVKRAALDIQAAKDELANAEALRRYHVEQTSTGVQQKLSSADPELQRAYNELKATLSKGEILQGKDLEAALRSHLADKVTQARSYVTVARGRLQALKDSVDAALGDFHDALDETLGEFKDAAKGVRADRSAALNEILGDRTKRLSLISRLQQAKMGEMEFGRQLAVNEQLSAHGLAALDEAAVTPYGKDGSLLDVLKKQWGDDTCIHIVSRDAWESYRELMNDIHSPTGGGSNGFFKTFDTLKSVWSGHLIYGPLFAQTRMRNFAQLNVASLFGGLFSPTAHYEARTALGAFGAAMKTGEDMTEQLASQMLSGTKYTLKDALDLARSRGIVDAAGYASETGLTLEQLAQRSNNATLKDYVKDLPSAFGLSYKRADKSAWLQLGMSQERWLDNQGRLASFFTGLKKGYEPDVAASEVRKWLYDSSRMQTWTERTVFRRLIPFYSFMKYSVGQFADLYFSRPAAVTTFEKIRQNAFAATGVNPKNIDTVLPSYIADGYGIPWRKTEAGPQFSLFGTFLPVAEVAKIAGAFDRQFSGQSDPSASPLMDYFFQNMHPGLRALAETAWNRDFHADRPIEDFPGQSLEMFGIPMNKQMVRLARNLRFVSELDRLNVLNLGEMKVMLDAVKRDTQKQQLDPLTNALSGAFSPIPLPRTYQIDVPYEAQMRQYQDNEKLRDAKTRMTRLMIGEQGPTTKVDLEALQRVYADLAARSRRRSEAEQGYVSPASASKPVKPSSDPLERLLLGR